MSRHLMIGCLTVALSFVSAAPAAASTIATTGAVYDTVDAVEVWGSRIIVTGIVSGDSGPSELSYIIYDGSSSSTPEGAARCDRLAMFAIAKPGKYQFATVTISGLPGRFGCKLIVRAP